MTDYDHALVWIGPDSSVTTVPLALLISSAWARFTSGSVRYSECNFLGRLGIFDRRARTPLTAAYPQIASVLG
jgi:hypothetical protein